MLVLALCLVFFVMRPLSTVSHVDSAFYPPWDDKMSTISQRAVMLCGWAVKAGTACLQVKLCVAIFERFTFTSARNINTLLLLLLLQPR